MKHEALSGLALLLLSVDSELSKIPQRKNKSDYTLSAIYNIVNGKLKIPGIVFNMRATAVV